jgi:hypothetical protein
MEREANGLDRNGFVRLGGGGECNALNRAGGLGEHDALNLAGGLGLRDAASGYIEVNLPNALKPVGFMQQQRKCKNA